MSTLNTCAPAAVATRRADPEGWWPKALAMATQAHAAWRERARARADWRVLQELSDETLRDIGWGERSLSQPTLGRFDHERGRWQ